MNQDYIDTVRLLLDVAPAVFQSPRFAMKGGTALNLFVQDMPRLSVDIDVVAKRCCDTPSDMAIVAELHVRQSGDGRTPHFVGSFFFAAGLRFQVHQVPGRR